MRVYVCKRNGVFFRRSRISAGRRRGYRAGASVIVAEVANIVVAVNMFGFARNLVCMLTGCRMPVVCTVNRPFAGERVLVRARAGTDGESRAQNRCGYRRKQFFDCP